MPPPPYRFAFLALGLEGTLVSNVVDQISRPGLFRFVGHCSLMFDEVVVFTRVPEDQFRAMASRLVEQSYAPGFLSSMRHVHCTDGKKDLKRIPPFACEAMTLLVDHAADPVVPGEATSLLPVPLFEPCTRMIDATLPSLLPQLARHVVSWRWDGPTKEGRSDCRFDLPRHWSPESLTTDQMTDLLTLIAAASGITTSYQASLRMLDEYPSAFGGKTALEWVRCGRSDTAFGYMGSWKGGSAG